MTHCDKRVLAIFLLFNVVTNISTNQTDSSKTDMVEDETEMSITTKRIVPDRCLVKTEPGPCKHYVHKWTYNKAEGKCRTFPYGGCLGNENRFNSEAECLYHCVGGTDRKLFSKNSI